MIISEQTSNILNGVKWQLLRTNNDSAHSIIGMLKGTYGNILYIPGKGTKSVMAIFNSLHNLQKNNVTIKQLCEWVEQNNGTRIKNKRDYEYIVYTIANNA